MAMFFVPGATLRRMTVGCGAAFAMPMSTANTSARAARAMRFTLALPAAIDCATRAVTSCPDCVTPSATTPWSAQKTSAQRGERLTSPLR